MHTAPHTGLVHACHTFRLAAQAAQAQALQAAQAVVAGAQALADNPPFNMMYIDNTQHLLQQQQQVRREKGHCVLYMSTQTPVSVWTRGN